MEALRISRLYCLTTTILSQLVQSPKLSNIVVADVANYYLSISIEAILRSWHIFTANTYSDHPSFSPVNLLVPFGQFTDVVSYSTRYYCGPPSRNAIATHPGYALEEEILTARIGGSETI